MSFAAPQQKLLLHPEAVRAFLKNDWQAPPVSVEISPTNHCNAKCDWCCVAGTLVDTVDGLVPIERIGIGDRVFGPDGKVSKVTAIGSRYVDELWVIRCENHELRVSGEHPILSEYGWKKASELRPGIATVVRVRMRSSSIENQGEMEQIRDLGAFCKRKETVQTAENGFFRENEEIKPHEADSRSQEGICIKERKETDLQPGARQETSRNVSSTHVFGPQSHEKSEDRPQSTETYSQSTNFEVRKQLLHLVGENKSTYSTDFNGCCLDKSQEPRLQNHWSEESNRAHSKHSVHPESGECQKNSSDIRPANSSTLLEKPLAMSSSFSQAECDLSTGVTKDNSELCIERISLERGLALRPIRSIRTIHGRVQVYNFSCEPIESYEANGFVVHNCFYVSSEYKQKHSKEELPYDILCRSLVDMKFMGVRAITWTGGGDPSVYSHIDECTQHAHSIGLKQGIFTNAYKPLKHPELYEWIRITVTEKFTITRHVAAYARATRCGVNFNLTAENERHLPAMVKAAREAGCAYFQVRPALADRWELQQRVECPTWLKDFATATFQIILTEYKFEDYQQPHGYPLCHGHRITPFLWHNGDVSVCAYHFGKPDYLLGNIIEQEGFEGVWRGRRRERMVKEGVAVIPDCQHCCKLHETNKVLAALSGDTAALPDDIDFI